MINNVPAQWDMEADVVAVGSGIGGLAAAITAHDHGAGAIVLERTDKVGGVTALSLGEVWVPGNRLEAELGIEDSPESGFRYLKRLAMGYADDAAILNLTVHARAALDYFEDRIGLAMMVIRGCPDYYYGHSNDSVAEGRLLEVRPFPAATLGEWQERTRVSPIAPYGMTHPDMMERGGTAHIANWDYALMGERLANDERCLGPGLAAYFVKGALDRGIPLHTGFDVQELIGDGGRIVGVRAVADGRDVFVRAHKGVVVAVSSYERNQGYNKTLAHQLDLGSMVFATVDGANFRLMGPAGARIAKVPDITMAGFRVPGEEQEDGSPLTRSAMQPIGLPHTIVVNRKGRRFGNEAFYRQFLYMIDVIDGGNQTHPNFPCWAILDSQARAKYPFGSVMPGQEFPEGMAVKADTLAELARRIGIDAAGLEETVARFNAFAEKGEDPDFGRGTHVWSAYMSGDKFHTPNPNLGAVAQGPFYAVELVRTGGSAIPSTGVVADQHQRVMGWDEQPIAGLYAAGNSVARLETGAVMQSGVSNARGMVHGWLAGLHVAGRPSALLQAEVARGTLGD
ncbi:MAG: FAD-binding protein [Novosphingobium sp.]